MSIVGGRRVIPKKGADYYPTPAWATEALLHYEKFRGPILEPCCGEGFMSRVLEQKGYEVISSDLYDYGYGKAGVNALKIKKAVNVVTNPPFNLASKIVIHFSKITKRKVALLLRLSFLESKDRYEFFKMHPPARIYLFTQRLSMYPAGKKMKGSGTVSYAWFIWENGFSGDPVIKWIEPVFKRPGHKPRYGFFK